MIVTKNIIITQVIDFLSIVKHNQRNKSKKTKNFSLEDNTKENEVKNTEMKDRGRKKMEHDRHAENDEDNNNIYQHDAKENPLCPPCFFLSM